MPIREWDQGFTPVADSYDLPPAVTPSFSETVGAAFRLENDVAAAIDLMGRRPERYDPTFDLPDRLRKDNIVESDWEHYLGVRNQHEYTVRAGEIQQENKDRQITAGAGGWGVVASIGAGLLSPTMFLPVIGGASRVGAAAKVALSVATGTTVQESLLMASQVTRTKEEAAFSIAASAVLGGLLGGAARFATAEDLEKAASGMAVLPGKKYGGTTGAAVTPEELLNIPTGAGKFAPAPGIDTMSRLGPVTRGIQQPHAPTVNGVKLESPEYRAATSQFGDAGLVLEGNKAGIAAAPGGALEDQITTYARYSADHIGTFNDAYNKYFFDGVVPKIGAGLRTLFGKQGKMSKEDFAKAVTETLWTGEAHSVAQINEVAAKAKNVFDALYKEAQEVGIFKTPEGEDVAEVVGDVGYAMRDWQPALVNNGYNELLRIFKEHYGKQLQERFQKQWLKFSERQSKTMQLIDDLSTGQEEAAALLAKFRQEIGEMEKRTPGVAEVDEEIAAIRAMAAKERDKEKLKALVQQRKALIKAAGDAYPEYKLARKKLATRLHNITRSRGLTKLRQRKKLAMIDKNEEMALKVMNRAVRRGQSLLKFLQSGSDAELQKAFKEFQKAYDLAVRVYQEGEEKIAKFLESDDPDTQKLFAFDDMQTARAEKMKKAMARLEELRNFDIETWRAEVQRALDDILEPYTNLVKRRGVREDRLVQAAEKLDPKYAEARAVRLMRKVKIREEEADLRFGPQGMGGELVDLKTGKADFTEHARMISEQVIDRIRHANGRLAWADLIREKRGPEYARVLNIPSTQVAQFLETDINRLIISYVKTMAADVSIARKFGSSNMREVFDRLLGEEHVVLQKLPEMRNKKGEPLSPEEMEKASKKVTDFYRQARADLETLLMRARHTRGAPEDPQSWATRGARLALNINTARFMGSVALSSAADPARWVMKYGLTGVMRDGLVPMITNLKTLKMNWREAKLAGTALDVVLHSRARQIFDVFDDTMRGSKFEKGVEWSATKIGMVGAFDYWNSAMKQFTSGLAVAKLMRSIEVVMSENPGAKELAKATTYLAHKNITPAHMKTIWRNVTSGEGGGKVDGVWLPNTDSWPTGTKVEADALRSFRSALVSDIDDTIVTPGFERPSIMDSNTFWKLMFQFKSFGMSSTFKTLMAGMQQRDAAFMNGIMISLGLGALSYYLWARSVGGKAETEMENAGLDKWADEMIARSGVMGVFSEVQRAAQHVPYLQKVASFSGRPPTNRAEGELTEALLGPSFDLLERAGGAIVNIDNRPASSVHNVRTMLPWQNVFYLRRGFDAMEEFVIDNANLQQGAR